MPTATMPGREVFLKLRDSGTGPDKLNVLRDFLKSNKDADGAAVRFALEKHLNPTLDPDFSHTTLAKIDNILAGRKPHDYAKSAHEEGFDEVLDGTPQIEQGTPEDVKHLQSVALTQVHSMPQKKEQGSMKTIKDGVEQAPAYKPPVIGPKPVQALQPVSASPSPKK